MSQLGAEKTLDLLWQLCLAACTAVNKHNAVRVLHCITLNQKHYEKMVKVSKDSSYS